MTFQKQLGMSIHFPSFDVKSMIFQRGRAKNHQPAMVMFRILMGIHQRLGDVTGDFDGDFMGGICYSYTVGYEGTVVGDVRSFESNSSSQ